MAVIQVLGEENKYWALIKRAQEMMPIIVGEIVIQYLGLSYDKLEMASLNDLITNQRSISEDVSNYCLVLPWTTQQAGVDNTTGNFSDSISKTYAIINSNWDCYYGINGGGFKKPVTTESLQ